MTMTNWEKAQLIVAALNEHGAGLENGAWAIVGKALDTIDAQAVTVDEYMPTDEEWAANPWAMCAATDAGGELWLYDDVMPEQGTETPFWWVMGYTAICLRGVTPPADFRTTLRHRPANI